MDPHVPFWKEDFKESWNLWKKKMDLFDKVTRKSNGPSSKIFFFFFKTTQGPNAPSPKTFFIWKFYSFLGKIWKSRFFFFFGFFLIYIHKQSTLDATWNFWIQRNIETWNKQTNFKLNHDIANLMWSEAKLGNLLLLGPFTMLETWYAWILIMMKWLGLALGRLQPWL